MTAASPDRDQTADMDRLEALVEAMAQRMTELENTISHLTTAPGARPAAPNPALADLVGLTHVGRTGSADSTAPIFDRGPLDGAEPHTGTDDQDGSGDDAAPGDPDANDGRVDRRRLITRAGVVAAGAVLGGAAATVATASPAAAATGSFDTSTSTPALTASSTGTGAAMKATNTSPTTGARPALDVSGDSAFAGPVSISSPTGSISLDASGGDIGVDATGTFFGLRGTGGFSGVFGQAQGSVGTTGESLGAKGAGLRGKAEGGTALILDGGTYATIEMFGTATAPTSTPVLRNAGQVVYDKFGVLWFSIAAGTPGTWVRLAGPATTGALTVLPSPVRVYDSRPGQPPNVAPQTKLPANTPRTGIALTTNNSTIPTDATAAILTATVANTAGGSPAIPGFLTIYPSGIATPITSNLNWTTPGAVTANATTVALGAGATIAALANYATDLIIDAIAYYR